MRVETIRFVARNEDEAYFIRAMHQLAAGCLLLGAEGGGVDGDGGSGEWGGWGTTGATGAGAVPVGV
ncbi:MAG TPA: hypothetical protein VFB89_00490 [Gemmatimonadales bacterium]|nr:hypothetical protein [Gemmatimonadales bacterium]